MSRLRVVSAQREQARRALVVIGDALLDRDVRGRVHRLAPDAPVPVLDESGTVARPGGAALAAMLAARDSQRVTLVTALAPDEPAGELRAAIADEGIELIELRLPGSTPEKVRFHAEGHALLRVDRGGGAAPARASDEAMTAVHERLAHAGAVLVSDYGRGVAARPELRDALGARSHALPVVWDPHPRGIAPVPGVTVATPNEAELAHFCGTRRGACADRAQALRARWRAGAMCVTRGASGALLARPDMPPLALPAPAAAADDPCGAGDRFSARLAGALVDGTTLEDAALAAVAAASAFVAAGGAGAIGNPSSLVVASADPLATIERVRARGGTVVATGGCFDLLHAGHVRTLEAARRLGDCLVVCLNSDDSVRRLKGRGRPVVPQADRAAVLTALGCVDAVVAFDDDTPREVLERLRPDVWAKGGDYAGATLPEEGTLASWGGRVVLLPFVEGRSTTRLIEEAAYRA